MSEALTANLCLGWLVCGWPLALFALGVLVGRHGWRGLWRGLLQRIPRPAPRDTNYS